MPPPTDPVFTNPGPPQGSPAAPTTAAAPASTTNSGAPQGTPDFDARIATAIAPLATSIKAIEKFMGSVSDHLQGQPAASAASTVEAPEGEFWSKFTANPEGAVDERFGKVAGPLISQLASTQVKSQMDKYRGEIDGQWGSGAFDAHIKDDLQSIVNRALQQNPAAVLNSEALETTRDALIGRKVMGLADHKQKAQATSTETASKETTDAVQAALQKLGVDPTVLSGGIRRVSPTSEKLPDELHEYLAGKLRDTGVKMDEKRAVRMMHTGNTFAEWEAANAELEGKK